MTVAWSSLGTWQALKLNLQIEAEAFLSSRRVVLITPADDSGMVLTLESGSQFLKLTWVPERNAVRWDLEHEYGFEKVSMDTKSLARELLRRLRRS